MSRRFPYLTLCTVLLLPLCSCNRGLDRIDAATARVLRHNSALLGHETRTPAINPLEKESATSPSMLDSTPPTVNPPLEALQYDQASADRDVAESLERYARIDEREAIQIDLETALSIAQQSADEFLFEEEEYILAAIRLLIERHLWNPRLFNDTDATVSGDFDSNDTALRVINELAVTQRLPFGGDVAARFVYDATEQLRATSTEDYTQATSLILDGNIPLLRGAGLAARESRVQAERDIIYAARDFERFRRRFLVDIANDFFNLVSQLDAIANQERSIESQQQSLERTAAQVEAGKKDAFQERQIRQNVLQAESTLIAQRERYIVALDRFKTRLGIDVTTPVVIVDTELDLPEPRSNPAQSAQLALAYRLDLQNARDRVDDSRRGVRIARNDLLPDLDLSGSLAFGSQDDHLPNFDGETTSYSAGVTFGLPLDREIERLQLRQATIDLQRQQRSYNLFRDNIILEARAARRNIDQQRFTILLADQRVENNELSREQQILKEGDPFDLTQAENALLEAENDRDRAIQALRTGILDYLLTTGQLRVGRDGTLLPLPGMESDDPQQAPPQDGDTSQ
ncbi:MAG: TolC family protein [Phycisphaerales bacterium JB043]